MKYPILIVMGLGIGLFSLVIPFADKLPENIEDIIYFRGILLAGLLFNIFGAANLKGFYQNIVIAIGGGLASLIIMSTYNLFCDVCIDTYNYYFYTFIIVAVTLLVLIILKYESKYFRRRTG